MSSTIVGAGAEGSLGGALAEGITAQAGGAASRPRRAAPVLAAAWLTIIVLLAAFANLLPLRRYDAILYPPFLAPGFSHPDLIGTVLGTDQLGRSELSRVIFGAQVSLLVGVLSTALGVAVGGAIGAVAGYFRGPVDTFVTLIVDAALAFPAIVLLLALSAVLTPNVLTLALILAFLTVPAFVRLARASTMSFTQRESVAAARLMGAGHLRILVREVLPNIAYPIASYAFLVVAQVIVAESSLSFLGVGIPPPRPSWGGMIAAGMGDLATYPSVVFVPAVVMLLTIMSLSVLGDSLRLRLQHRPGALR